MYVVPPELCLYFYSGYGLSNKYFETYQNSI